MFGKRQGKQKRTFREQVSNMLEIQPHMAEGMPEISLFGNREAVVDRCLGVLEYNDKVIRLNTGKVVLKFTGQNLSLKTMDRSSATVQGFFTGIEFI